MIQRSDKTGGDYISHRGSVLNPHCYMKTTIFFQGRNVCEQTLQEIWVTRDTQRTLTISVPTEIHDTQSSLYQTG